MAYCSSLVNDSCNKPSLTPLLQLHSTVGSRTKCGTKRQLPSSSTSLSTPTKRLYYLCSLVILCLSTNIFPSTEAFVVPGVDSSTRALSKSSTSPNQASFHPSKQHKQQQKSLSMSWADVSEFYRMYPIPSAVLTCGFKASLADGIAQFRTIMYEQTKQESLELRRNLAYVVYGGLFVGIMCHVEYNEVFPLLFGTEQPHVLEKVLVDDFVAAPFMWLPPAYLIKAILYDYPLQEGVSKYWKDITQHGLLWRYWSIWVPAQTVSFSVVPEHLRVAFMASVSFFWFILFSTVASKSDAGTVTPTSNDNHHHQQQLQNQIASEGRTFSILPSTHQEMATTTTTTTTTSSS